MQAHRAPTFGATIAMLVLCAELVGFVALRAPSAPSAAVAPDRSGALRAARARLSQAERQLDFVGDQIDKAVAELADPTEAGQTAALADLEREAAAARLRAQERRASLIAY